MFQREIQSDKEYAGRSGEEFSQRMPLAEKLKIITGIFGIRLSEEPEYRVIRSNGEKEIRKYSPLTLASITVPVNENRSLAQIHAYRSLTDYILGKNKLSRQIGRTTAVLYANKKQMDGTDRLTVSFILDGKSNVDNTPEPLDQRIKIFHRDSHMVACRVYSGLNDDEKELKHTSELRGWLSQYSNSYRSGTEIRIAQYDEPSTLSFLRKNEVHIDVRGICSQN